MRRAFSRRLALAAVALPALLCLSLAPGSLAASAPTHVTASGPATSPLGLPGPVLRGKPATQTPQASDFVTHCNSYVNSAAGHVGRTTIPAGTAVQAVSGCGVAVLILDAPGQGRFHATFGVAADDTTGQPAAVRIRVTGRDGYDLRISEVTASRAGGAQAIDVDVSKATALTLSFLSTPKTFVYAFRLSGTARTLRPAAGNGGALPAGATPLNMAGASYSCNAQAATAPMSVTLVTVPAAGAATVTGCGQILLRVAPGTTGSLVLRYGAVDSASTGGRMTLSVRVLNARGRLLRKATGIAFIGSGLQPLWVDLSHGGTVQITAEGTTDSTVAVTALGILRGRLPPYSIANRTLSGGAPGASVAIDPEAFVSNCNSSVGTQDTSVAHAPVFGGTYFATFACGTSSLIFCCTTAAGTFHALFGVPDTGASGGPPAVTVVALNRDSHPLRQLTVHAVPGAPGTPLDVRIDRASVLSFAFSGGSGVLYDMRLSGTATISDLIYPPSTPPVNPANGMAVDPHDFALRCNAYLADTDQRLVGATSLEGWALYGEGCGEADLNLAGTHYPRHRFDARIGIKIGESPRTLVTIRLNVLNAAGKVIRHREQMARYGYGTQSVHVSLAGGTVLQIQWLTTLSTTVVYAMTAS